VELGEGVSCFGGVFGYDLGRLFLFSHTHTHTHTLLLDSGFFVDTRIRELILMIYVVLSVRISFLFLCGLSYVAMVSYLFFLFSVESKFEDLFADLNARLVIYAPGPTIVRMLTTNALIAYISSWVLYLLGASRDPSMLLPAWMTMTLVKKNKLLFFVCLFLCFTY
jgi:hypothetical protein